MAKETKEEKGGTFDIVTLIQDYSVRSPEDDYEEVRVALRDGYPPDETQFPELQGFSRAVWDKVARFLEIKNRAFFRILGQRSEMDENVRSVEDLRFLLEAESTQGTLDS